MQFVLDVHLHSRFARATSRDLNCSNLHKWSALKGVDVVGTGDYTHPEWFAELSAELEPAEDGLYRLRAPWRDAVERELPERCRREVRFMLSVEISTIYKKGEKTRKIHHIVILPSLDAVARLNQRLGAIGNLHADGRPILGLDSRDLLEICLEADPDALFVPAHIWTPHFAALGASSGFDSLVECYGDLLPHIFAVETGPSSDPPMNWRLSALDRFALISNSTRTRRKSWRARPRSSTPNGRTRVFTTRSRTATRRALSARWNSIPKRASTTTTDTASARCAGSRLRRSRRQGSVRCVAAS